VKQMRALYANESRMASLYADEEEGMVSEEISEPVPTGGLPHETPSSSELVKIEIGDHALTAALVDRMDAMNQRQAQTDAALIAALHAIGTRNPVVNVEPPSVQVEAPNVSIEPPAVTVEAPEVTVTPEFHVRPEITVTAPESRPKVVTFERDPLTGDVSRAEVNEG
jgi:hypothetical protein